MKKHNFTVIPGGVALCPSNENRQFISAYVTDTRLMGVVGVLIRWHITDPAESRELYQLFYYDAEEYGLETYTGLYDPDTEELEQAEQTLFGGLGGKKIDITKKEAFWLIRSFAEGSKRLNAPLPDPKEEYLFLCEDVFVYTPEEQTTIVKKMSTPIRSDYQLINYYLMRSFAGDHKGAAYLTNGEIDTESIFPKIPATLCQNRINEYVDDAAYLSFMCESLLEINNTYYLYISEIKVENQTVISARIQSSFKITAAEAAMMLNKPEFMTVYEVMTDEESFDSIFEPMMRGALVTPHDNGRLYLKFNDTNDHVDQKVFRLNEDIHGMLYISDFGQLLAVAYSLDDIHDMERILRTSPLSPFLAVTSRYEFKEPVLYEFIKSNYDDFQEFLKALQDPE